MTETLDDRRIEPFVSTAPNLASTIKARPYDLEGVARFDLRPTDGLAGYRCWSLPDQSLTVFVRDDGQVLITGEFVGDYDALARLIDVLIEEVQPVIPAAPVGGGERS